MANTSDKNKGQPKPKGPHKPKKVKPQTVKPKTVDDYLASVTDEQRTALEKLRQKIKATVPQAEECISYGIAAFRTNRMLVGFGATKNHCAFYLMSATVLDAFANELADRDTSKGTIRFLPDQPLPTPLIRKLVKARVAENAALDESNC